MHPQIRAQNIERIADALPFVAQNFERFGGLLIDLVVGQSMTHEGINLRGFPVNKLVDSVSADGLTAAAYSAEQGYFDGEMLKATGDVRQILTVKPTVKNIYLLSALKKRAQLADNFHTKVLAWPEMAGRALHIWGSEEIGALLLDEVLVSVASVSKLAEYLPVLQRIWDEEANSNAPKRLGAGHLNRPDIDSDLTARLDQKRAVAIAGMPGLGKSEAAAAYAAAHEEHYPLPLWFEGEDVRRVENLRSIPLLAGGEHRNLTELLRSSACLLIVDNAPDHLSVDALADLCGPKSRAILTRRFVGPGDYQLPLMAPDTARLLLNRGMTTPCPDPVFDLIWQTVGGHPLSLTLMNGIKGTGVTWDVIADDCEAVGELEDKSQRLADRLIGHLRTALSRELSVFEWAARADCESGFLQHVIRRAGVRRLQGHGLTAADRASVVRLHDVVYSALAAQYEWWTPTRRVELNDTLVQYLETTVLEHGLRFPAVSHSLKSKIESLVRDGDRRPALLYALLSTCAPRDLDVGLVGDPVETARLWGDTLPSSIAVMTVIEAVEKLYLYEREVHGRKLARENLAVRVELFSILGRLPGLSDRQVSEIAHHRGKAYRRLGDRDAAIKMFEGVLSGPYPLMESRLQLLLLHRRARSNRATELVSEILQAAERGEDVTFSVLLAAMERLPWVAGPRLGELVKLHATKIEKTIVAAGNIGLQQAFKTFASVGRFYSQEEPELFNRIFQALPQHSLDEGGSDEDRAAWADILFEASRTPGNDTRALQGEALRWFESETSPEPFHLQRHAELLIDMGRHPEAETILLDIDNPPRPEFVERLMARCRLASGDPARALQWIDRALEHLKAERFVSEFRELRFDIRTALGDAGAKEDLRLAIDSAAPGERKNRLEAKLRTA